MIGKNIGLVALLRHKMKETNPDSKLINFHCIMHQEALCSKVGNFKDVMNIVVKTVNKIRANSLNHREFQSLLDEVDAQYSDVLYHSEVRWLSRGIVLKRFYDLIHEIDLFMINKGKQILELSDPDWIFNLSFLINITAYLNELNLKLQGRDQIVIELFSHIKAFTAKLRLWKKQISEINFMHFNTCQQVKDKYPNIEIDSSKFIELIENLKMEFEERFSDFKNHKFEFELFVNPFIIDVNIAPKDLQYELIELQAHSLLKSKFDSLKLIEFYKLLPNSYKSVINNALKIISMFGSTYLCEQLFSTMKFKKTKNLTRITEENLNACLKLSSANKIKPNIDYLVSKKQCQSTH